MSDIHIDDFFRDAAITLNRLYLSFPRPTTIFVEDISGPANSDEFGIPDNRYMACFSTLLWLAEESYLRYTDTIRQEAIDQSVLTGRCFNVLSARCGDVADVDLPTSIRAEQNTRIARLRDALKSGSSSAVRAAMTEIMTLMN